MDGAARPAGTGDLEATLRARLRGEVRFDGYTRGLYSRDASMYAIEPLGVVFPRDREDVVSTVATAAEAGVAVLPRGAGTSLAGQTVGRAVVMDFSRHMDAIVAIDPHARTARVQPGVVQDQLNRAAAAHRLMFGPDTSTSNRATLGGMIGNNSAGSHSIRYGMTIDHVLALDVVLADASTATFEPCDPGEARARAGRRGLEGALYRGLPTMLGRYRDAIATGYPPFWRRSGGYRLDRLAATAGLDLASFVVGSEGTLVTVAEATVALVPRPAHRAIAVGHFASTQAAIEATGDALECAPAAVELMDRTILELSGRRVEYRGLRSLLTGDPEALLFVTFLGDSEPEVAAACRRLSELWRRHGHGYHTLLAVAPAEQAALLKVRQAGLGLLMAASSGTRRPLAFVEDTAVDPARLVEYTAGFRAVLDRHRLAAGFYGHASVGCLHIRPFVDLRVPGAQATMRAVAAEIRDLVLEFGGVNSSEHGDGLARSEFNRAVHGDALYQAMRETKALFDPANRMNPGKIVDAPAMTEHLRDPALPDRPELPTRLRFEAGGMRAAADRCMNIGACRKSGAGVMCPSYMATREEEHSTRGRAGALMHALTMPDPRAALGDERLHDILDLCLECKACKSECPLGVDMASLKAEFLAAYQDQHGVPLRSRLLGSIRRLNRAGSALAPLTNGVGRFGPGRRLAEHTLGVSADRPLPRFARTNLVRWAAKRRPPPTAVRGDVVLLADSFTTYTEPSVPIAAFELLELAGWRVHLEHAGCCGRASLSKGLVDRAGGMAAAMVDRLRPAVAAGWPVVGVEPSCVLTVRDDYPALVCDHPGTAEVAGAAGLAEDLLLEAVADGALPWSGGEPLSGARIVFHGHCHQKAVVGTAATVALLRAVPGVQVEELDAGCCGMAGSFGFESEHYQLSMRIGELRLFPAVRAEPAATIVTATGVSCRQQIAHGTGRTALHPLEVVRRAVGPRPS